jgi:AcrR family transcriptional regulator
MEKKPGRDTYHRKDLKRLLMRSVREELREFGVTSASLRRIAKRAGVSHAAPYRHFKGRDGLLAALCWEGQREFTSRLKKAREGAPFAAERLFRLGKAYLEFAQSEPEAFDLMFSETGDRVMRADFPAGLKESYDQYDSFGVLERTVKECQAEKVFDPAEDSGALAILIWAFVHGLAFIRREGFTERMGGSRGLSAETTERLVLRAFRGLVLGAPGWTRKRR